MDRIIIGLLVVLVLFAGGVKLGIDLVYDAYCHSIEYDNSIYTNDSRYCVDNDDPENLFYIPWQE